MPTDVTKAVLDHHTATLDAGDVDGLMEDYTEDSVFISNLGRRGPGPRRHPRGLRRHLGGDPGFEAWVEHVDGDSAT